MSKEIKECWNCKSKNVKPAPAIGEGWYQCPDCGATDLPNPVALGQSDLTQQKNDGLNVMEPSPRRRRRLSPKRVIA